VPPLPPAEECREAMSTTRILQLSDLHLFADPEERLFGIPTRELLEAVVAHARELAGPLDHVVITGDHSHDDLPETYESLRQILGPWLDRLWQLPGNHDDRAVLREVFPERIAGQGSERIAFAFPAGGWLCLGLDTQLTGEVAGRIDSGQIEWVHEQVRRQRPDAVALFLHHPPVTLGRAWLDRIGLEGKELLQKLMLEEPRIRLACCGHVHHESSHRVGNAEIVTTPSTGLQFSDTSDVPLFVQAPPGYRLIELSDDGYSTRVVRLPGAGHVPEQQ